MTKKKRNKVYASYVPKPIGTLPFKLGWRGAFHGFTVEAGPYDAYLMSESFGDKFGVAVRAEFINPYDADVHLPIHDFSVPAHRGAVEEALLDTFEAGIRGKPIYVGCAGGLGRTGLFLALMAKVVGIKDPVAYVRSNYSPRAVETKDQKEYVEQFDVSTVRSRIFQLAWYHRVCG